MTTTEDSLFDPKELHICYPITKNARGDEFDNDEEILAHLDNEPAGFYLLGRNGMWHGAIHISAATSPWCALSGKGPSESTDFPMLYKGEQSLRCMADGEVVAYRICKDYLYAPWPSGELSYSGSFVLIRHYLQPGDEKKSGLMFYTLYMHLAPWSAYQKHQGETSWKINEKTGLSAYENAERTVRLGTLPDGTQIRWDENNEVLKTQTWGGRIYGHVTLDQDVIINAHRKTSETKLFSRGDMVWVLADRTNLKTTEPGVIQPAWWAHFQPPFKQVLEFDKVVCPTPVHINAKDPVGHLGYYQSPVSSKYIHGYTPRYQAHIECVSADENLPTFLTNPEKVESDNLQYLKYVPGLPRYNKNLSTFRFIKETQATSTTGVATLSEITSAREEADGDKPAETYYQILPENAWLAKNDVALLSRYDLAERGFVLTDDTPQSFNKLGGRLPPESLIKKILEILHHSSQQDTRIDYALVPHNYRRLIEMLNDDPRSISPNEYRQAIHIPHMRDTLFRIIAKHPSEWYFKPSDSLWQKYLSKLAVDDPQWKEYNETVIEKLGWIQQLDKSKVALGAEFYHMHPVMFLGAIKRKTGLITLVMLRKVWSDQRYVSDGTLQQVADELNANLDLCHLNTEFRLYHFMAQVLQETGPNFSISENLNYSPSALPVFFKYYRRHPAEQELDGRTSSHPANQENIANKAYGDGRNGNNLPGDGWRYRGRGMKQLTGRENYKKFTDYHALKWGGNVDFVLNPELLAYDIKYAVRSALAFWDNNMIYAQADKGYSLQVSLAVTNIINSGLSLEDKKVRYGNLEYFLTQKIFQNVY